MAEFFDDEFIKIEIQMLAKDRYRPVILFKGADTCIFQEEKTSEAANLVAAKWLRRHLNQVTREIIDLNGELK